MSTIRATYVQHGSSAVPNITLNASGQIIVASGIVSSGTFAAPSGSVSAPGIYFNGDSNTGLYSPAADTIAFTEGGVEALRIDSSGRVGIGTSSPSQRLHVIGSADDAVTNLVNTDTTNGYGLSVIAGGSASGRYIARFADANNNVKAIILADGKVGIGTTSPASIIHASGSSGSIGLQVTSGSSSGEIAQSGVDFYVVNKANGPTQFWTNGSERARIDSSGRLLVGTSSVFNVNTGDGSLYSPGFQRVGTSYGDATLSATLFNSAASGGGGTLALGKSNTNSIGSQSIVANGDVAGSIYFSGSDGSNQVRAALIKAEIDGTPGANDMPGRLVFSTTADGASSPTERMRITNDGRLKVSTNGSYIDTTGYGHELLNRNGVSGDRCLYVGLGSNTNNTSSYFTIFTQVGVADRYYIYGNGTTGTPSDNRLKKNIETTRDGYLDDIKQLRVVKYNWNEQEDGEPKELGIIAQELEQVFPGLIQEGPEQPDGNCYKAVKTSVLPFILLKALQEATAKIESLETRLSALESA